MLMPRLRKLRRGERAGNVEIGAVAVAVFAVDVTVGDGVEGQTGTGVERAVKPEAKVSVAGTVRGELVKGFRTGVVVFGSTFESAFVSDATGNLGCVRWSGGLEKRRERLRQGR
jgi:hypothetical protein